MEEEMQRREGTPGYSFLLGCTCGRSWRRLGRRLGGSIVLFRRFRVFLVGDSVGVLPTLFRRLAGIWLTIAHGEGRLVLRYCLVALVLNIVNAAQVDMRPSQ